jgi:hypothetical protein
MHIYKRELSVANGFALTMPAGETTLCFRIGWPQEGTISRVIVCQSSDDPVAVGFTVRLFDRQVCELGAHASYSAAPIDDICMNTAKIIPDVSLPAKTAGQSLEVINDHGWPYRNREGSYAVPVKAIYMQITVDSDAQETNWEVGLVGEVGNEA